MFFFIGKYLKGPHDKTAGGLFDKAFKLSSGKIKNKLWPICG